MSRAGINIVNVNPFTYEKELELRGELDDAVGKDDYRSSNLLATSQTCRGQVRKKQGNQNIVVGNPWKE
jgi:hypothetical protein